MSKRSRKKRRRRAPKKRSLGKSRSRHGERSFGPIQIEQPASLLSSELRARLRTIPTPPHTVSGALFEVARPFLDLPIATDALEDLLEDLTLAAEIWNATLATTADDHIEALGRIVETWHRPGRRAETEEIVLALAERKLRMYPTDLRLIAQLTVREGDGEAIIDAKTLHLTPAGGAGRS